LQLLVAMSLCAAASPPKLGGCDSGTTAAATDECASTPRQRSFFGELDALWRAVGGLQERVEELHVSGVAGSAESAALRSGAHCDSVAGFGDEDLSRCVAEVQASLEAQCRALYQEQAQVHVMEMNAFLQEARGLLRKALAEDHHAKGPILRGDSSASQHSTTDENGLDEVNEEESNEDPLCHTLDDRQQLVAVEVTKGTTTGAPSVAQRLGNCADQIDSNLVSSIATTAVRKEVETLRTEMDARHQELRATMSLVLDQLEATRKQPFPAQPERSYGARVSQKVQPIIAVGVGSHPAQVAADSKVQPVCSIPTRRVSSTDGAVARSPSIPALLRKHTGSAAPEERASPHLVGHAGSESMAQPRKKSARGSSVSAHHQAQPGRSPSPVISRQQGVPPPQHTAVRNSARSVSPHYAPGRARNQPSGLLGVSMPVLPMNERSRTPSLGRSPSGPKRLMRRASPSPSPASPPLWREMDLAVGHHVRPQRIATQASNMCSSPTLSVAAQQPLLSPPQPQQQPLSSPPQPQQQPLSSPQQPQQRRLLSLSPSPVRMR